LNVDSPYGRLGGPRARPSPSGAVDSPPTPTDDSTAEKPATRTLTILYNERPTWLDLAHKRLDEAVFAAYGWPADLTDDDLLTRLLALNLERAGQRPAEPAASDPDASDSPPARSRRKRK
jgi:hypothetical protein